MANQNMTVEQIENELSEIGETGNAKVKNGGLYIQREENADWQFAGTVADEAEAKTVVSEHFNQ